MFKKNLVFSGSFFHGIEMCYGCILLRQLKQCGDDLILGWIDCYALSVIFQPCNGGQIEDFFINKKNILWSPGFNILQNFMNNFFLKRQCLLQEQVRKRGVIITSDSRYLKIKSGNYQCCHTCHLVNNSSILLQLKYRP